MFGLQNCVKFVLFKVHVQSYIWYQNNQKFEHLSENNPSVWYTWQHSHHGRICTTLFWTLNRSIFPQHSSDMKNMRFSTTHKMLHICRLWSKPVYQYLYQHTVVDSILNSFACNSDKIKRHWKFIPLLGRRHKITTLTGTKSNLWDPTLIVAHNFGLNPDVW